MDLAFQPSDWLPTGDGQAILRNNMPLLAYLAGKPAAFTSKDHNFKPGEQVEKQIIVINNSRETVTAACRWSLALPEPVSGTAKATVVGFVVPASAGSVPGLPEGETTNGEGLALIAGSSGRKPAVAACARNSASTRWRSFSSVPQAPER
jgi:hypothetical protein